MPDRRNPGADDVPMSNATNGSSPLLPLVSGIVYGPVRSRRLGSSLGLNVLPAQSKACTFNCVYCQYGWTTRLASDALEWPSPDAVAGALAHTLEGRAVAGGLDRITLAGHGEPTLHPDLGQVIRAVKDVRDRLAPTSRLAILSNGTRAHLPAVRQALLALDERYMKLDAGSQDAVRRVNASAVPLAQLVESLRTLPGIIVQSMFVDDPLGRCGNASPADMAEWLEVIRHIGPQRVHLYTLARNPALARLRPVARERIVALAGDLARSGIAADVFL